MALLQVLGTVLADPTFFCASSQIRILSGRSMAMVGAASVSGIGKTRLYETELKNPGGQLPPRDSRGSALVWDDTDLPAIYSQSGFIKIH